MRNLLYINGHTFLYFIYRKTFNQNANIPHFLLGTDDEDHEYDCLGAWGPRFDKLANMYGPEHQQDLDEL